MLVFPCGKFSLPPELISLLWLHLNAADAFQPGFLFPLQRDLGVLVRIKDTHRWHRQLCARWDGLWMKVWMFHIQHAFCDRTSFIWKQAPGIRLDLILLSSCYSTNSFFKTRIASCIIIRPLSSQLSTYVPALVLFLEYHLTSPLWISVISAAFVRSQVYG